MIFLSLNKRVLKRQHWAENAKQACLNKPDIPIILYCILSISEFGVECFVYHRNASVSKGHKIINKTIDDLLIIMRKFL